MYPARRAANTHRFICTRLSCADEAVRICCPACDHIVNHPLKNGYSVESVTNGGTRTVHLMRAAISFAICAELRDMNGILAP